MIVRRSTRIAPRAVPPTPVPQLPPGRSVSLKVTIVYAPAPPISVATAPHDSDVLTAIRSCSVSTVSTGVAFWNLLGSAK